MGIIFAKIHLIAIWTCDIFGKTNLEHGKHAKNNDYHVVVIDNRFLNP